MSKEALITKLREEATHDLHHETIALLIEAANTLAEQPAQQERCHLCDCTGDIHSADGEWRGECPYCKPAQQEQCPTCGEFEPRTGTCGTSVGDLRALCNRATPQPTPVHQEPVAKFKSPGQRWADGDDHDSRSKALYKFIADTDFKHCEDSFCFKSGGDGDSGETLMFILDCWFAQQSTSPQPAQQEPVAKPYAYEYGRDNGGGTYSVVIERGDLVQTAPAVYNYVRPRNAHKDWPIKELFDSQPAQRTWVGLIRGVRVEGDAVVITVKGGNDAARELCGALLKEKNT